GLLKDSAGRWALCSMWGRACFRTERSAQRGSEAIMERFADFPLRARAYLVAWWALGIPTVVAALVFGPGLVRPPAAIQLRGDPAPPALQVLMPALLAAFFLGRKKVLLTRAQPGRGPGASLSVAMVTTWVVLLFLGLWSAVIASAVGEVGRGTVG